MAALRLAQVKPTHKGSMLAQQGAQHASNAADRRAQDQSSIGRVLEGEGVGYMLQEGGLWHGGPVAARQL